MNDKTILATTPFFIINKAILCYIGIDASIVLSDLIQKRNYFNQTHQLKGGFFYNTGSSISCETTLSYYQIKQALNILEDKKFIQIKKKGLPAKNHFKIFDNKILKFLKTVDENISIQECENLQVNNNKEIIINKKNKLENSKDVFLQEVSVLEPKEYIEDFIDYWTEDNGKKMRFELEKTWNTNLRYKRWCKNQKNFSRGSNTNNMPDFLDSAYLNRIKEDQAQINKFYKHLVENCGYVRLETATGYIRYRKKV